MRNEPLLTWALLVRDDHSKSNTKEIKGALGPLPGLRVDKTGARMGWSLTPWAFLLQCPDSNPQYLSHYILMNVG